MKKSWLWFTIAGFAAVVLLGTIVGMIGCTNNIETNIDNVNLPVPPEGGEETGGGSRDEFATTTTTNAPVPPGGGEAVPGDPEFGPTTTSTSTTTTTTSTTSTTTTTIPLDVTIVTVDEVEGGDYIDIAVDPANKAHISFYDEENDDLKYATNVSGDWVTEVVNAAGGSHTSIALDSAGGIIISYWLSPRLKYAGRWVDGDDWLNATVDPGLLSIFVIGSTSVAIDSDNHPHFSYNTLENKLKYAYPTPGGDWVFSHETVDLHGGSMGTSMVVDAADNFNISYYDVGGDSLKYATGTVGSWDHEVVDSLAESPPGVGLYSSIALDRDNNVHISYYDAGNHHLKYATNASGSWVCSTIDSSPWVGQFTSIALDSDDKVHISYFDDSNDTVKYITNTSGDWVAGTVDSVGPLVGATSYPRAMAIAVDSADNVQIAYYDLDHNLLKHALIER